MNSTPPSNNCIPCANPSINYQVTGKALDKIIYSIGRSRLEKNSELAGSSLTSHAIDTCSATANQLSKLDDLQKKHSELFKTCEDKRDDLSQEVLQQIEDSLDLFQTRLEIASDIVSDEAMPAVAKESILTHVEKKADELEKEIRCNSKSSLCTPVGSPPIHQTCADPQQLMRLAVLQKKQDSIKDLFEKEHDLSCETKKQMDHALNRFQERLEIAETILDDDTLPSVAKDAILQATETQYQILVRSLLSNLS